MPEKEPVSVVTSLAHRRGGDVRVVLHLPGLDLPPGSGLLRCSNADGRRVRRPATITAADEGVRVEALFPAGRLRGAVWRLAVKAATDDAWLPVEARVLVGPRQPVALLPGPRPVTRLAEPVPADLPSTRDPILARLRRRVAARLRR
ncbi:MAG: hypothetical protein ABWX84_07100 [Nocardioides sp.]